MKHTTQVADSRPVRIRNGAATAAAPPPARITTRRRRRPRSQQWTAWAFLAPVVLYLALFYAYPLYR
ncbi:sugar ABC transporter permease, partial [Streptomyces sp. NPDC005474]